MKTLVLKNNSILSSICIPAYNTEKYILVTVEHLLSQTHQNIEVIMVEDGSNDNTLLEWKRIKDSRVKNISQFNKGLAAARN